MCVESSWSLPYVGAQTRLPFSPHSPRLAVHDRWFSVLPRASMVRFNCPDSSPARPGSQGRPGVHFVAAKMIGRLRRRGGKPCTA
jgi:hypothetical protein